jgi:hypothetical protein
MMYRTQHAGCDLVPYREARPGAALIDGFVAGPSLNISIAPAYALTPMPAGVCWQFDDLRVVADILPLMEGSEYEDLVASIPMNGSGTISSFTRE